MKIFIVFFSILLLLSCKTKEVNFRESKNISLISNCPKSGNCEIELTQNKNYKMGKDDSGAAYPIYFDDDSKILISFTYQKTQDPNLADDYYREMILMAIPNNLATGSYNNKELEQFNISYGRFCFCGDKVGYFNLEYGTLEVYKDYVSLNFKTNTQPQVINKVSFKLH